MTKIAVYGASGFTGALAAEDLTRRGVATVLVGRSEARLRAVAERIGAPDTDVRPVGLDAPRALADAFGDCDAVVNCVAPFEYFGEPVLRAALAAACHYVDTTGEQSYLKRVFDTDEYRKQAEHAGVTVVPAMSDDGGPGDFIARLTADALGGAVLSSLTIADLRFPAVPSRGTGRSGLANLASWESGGIGYADGRWVAGARPGPDAVRPPEGIPGTPDGAETANEVPVVPFALPGIVTVPRHVRVRQVVTVLRGEVAAAFAGLTAELVETLPESLDQRQRDAQRWLMLADAVTDDGRRATGAVTGTDGYGVTGFIAAEAAYRLATATRGHGGGAAPSGVRAPSEAFDAAEFLDALAPLGVRRAVTDTRPTDA